MFDWGIGKYEASALELEPAAQHVVRAANLAPGEHVLDVACGTGNAALLAARAGAVVTGLDGAQRLIEVARSRATADGLEASFVVGDAQELKFDDGSFDVVLSVFGVIFAFNAEQAFSEIIRVLRPGGRGLISAWLPGGGIDAMVGVFTRAIGEAIGRSAAPGFSWGDADAVRALAAGHGATVDFEEGEVAFVGESPDAYFAASEANHPMSLHGRALLEQVGTYPQVREEALDVLRAHNEDPDRFRATTRYRIIKVHRPA